MEALHLEQANTDFFILCELLKDYLGLLSAVRDAFHERTKMFQHWHHAQQMLAKKREAKTKFELACRTDKLDQAATEVLEVNIQLIHCKKKKRKRKFLSGKQKLKEARKISIRSLK